jgi:hypothetical protein
MDEAPKVYSKSKNALKGGRRSGVEPDSGRIPSQNSNPAERRLSEISASGQVRVQPTRGRMIASEFLAANRPEWLSSSLSVRMVAGWTEGGKW